MLRYFFYIVISFIIRSPIPVRLPRTVFSIFIQSLDEPQVRASTMGALVVCRLDELHAQLGHHARAELLLFGVHLLVFLYLTLQFLVLELELL